MSSLLEGYQQGIYTNRGSPTVGIRFMPRTKAPIPRIPVVVFAKFNSENHSEPQVRLHRSQSTGVDFMASFYIEMGQGVMAQSWLEKDYEKSEVRITTSSLYSCAFIGGYNEHTGWAGAFHYPAEELSYLSMEETLKKRFAYRFAGKVKESDWSKKKWAIANRYLDCNIKTVDGMLSWIQTLRPTVCILLEGRQSTAQDMNRLEAFVAAHGRVEVIRQKARGRDVAMMSTGVEHLKVADQSDFSDRIDFRTRIDVQTYSAGRHFAGTPQEMFIVDGHNVEALKLPGPGFE